MCESSRSLKTSTSKGLRVGGLQESSVCTISRITFNVPNLDRQTRTAAGHFAASTCLSCGTLCTLILGFAFANTGCVTIASGIAVGTAPNRALIETPRDVHSPRRQDGNHNAFHIHIYHDDQEAVKHGTPGARSHG